MPKVVGTRERVHTAFYKSILQGEQEALNALALRMMVRASQPPRPRQAATECRHCGAPRRDARTCDYCDRAYT